MLEQFLRHITQYKLFERSDSILLAVSGGLDSMVMLHLFKEAGFSIGVAHCNFQLRADEASADEELVRTTCISREIPYHVKQFETQKFANDNGISIQMAARELRYLFFNDLLNRYNYSYVSTAHHQDDNMESVFLNLVRGTGIEGLTGIPLKNNKIVRPMLFATRQEIRHYADHCGIQWREDSSNVSNKYHRNFLRNQVIPLLKQINPGIEDSFKDTLERLKGTADLQRQLLDNFKRDAVRESGTAILIDIEKLLSQPYASVVLWELIKEMGFNLDQCKAIVTGTHQSGKVFYTNKYSLTVDRTDFIITACTERTESEIMIAAEMMQVRRQEQILSFETGKIQTDFVMNRSSQVAQLDLDLLQFPLIWRKWRYGDSFVPLGMKQHKKISDFLIDAKISIPAKQQITVLMSAGEIVWVVGLRIDDRFKINQQSKRFLCIRYDGVR